VRLAERDVRRLVTYLASGCDPDDVAQECFVRVWGALPTFRAAGTGRSWLLGIARRTCADAVRDVQRRRRLLARAAFARRATSAPDHAADIALRSSVKSLDWSRREAFVLTQIVGLSYEEAADACEVPIGTIRSRVARARGDLVKMIEHG
jgi:RNA polymerase sigma-70 factor (ECF subfamily)